MRMIISRRQILRFGLFGSIGTVLAACQTTTSTPATSPPPTAAAVSSVAPSAAPLVNTPTTAPVSVPPSVPASAPPSQAPSIAPAASAAAPSASVAPSQAASVAPSAAPAAAANPTADLAASMVTATTQFLAALDAKQRAKATYDFNNDERVRWHWTTPSGFPRNGLSLKEMNQQQRDLAHALLRAGLSAAGYQKALDIISLQKELGNDTLLYFLTVFGTPGGSAPWGWRWEGHHLSHHYTIVGQRVSLFPFFLGSWPTVGNSGLRAMPREEDAARELINALTGPARDRARFQKETLTSHVTWNEPQVSALPTVGLPYSELAADHRRFVDEIMRTYLGTLPAAIAQPALARIKSAGLDQVYFGWAGVLEARKPHYYRLQGPTFLLEHDNSRNGGTHIHSVWRDFSDDFGRHLL